MFVVRSERCCNAMFLSTLKISLEKTRIAKKMSTNDDLKKKENELHQTDTEALTTGWVASEWMPQVLPSEEI
jgi:hypothetical protein